MRESVTVTMVSGRTYDLMCHRDESRKELIEEILSNDKFYVAGDIALNVNLIESIE